MKANPKILVVEDNDGLRDQVARILAMEDYSVIVAHDGEEGLRMAGESRPDLVLCDVMMPRMDGHQMLRALRATESGGALPFVFLTALAERGDVRAGMGMGADDYLTKPFGADELLATVKARLAKQKAIAARSTELMRDDSLVTLSHEIRTPLNGIIGLAELLMHDSGNEASNERYQMLRDLRASSLRLEHTLTNLMLHLDIEATHQCPARERGFRSGPAASVRATVQGAVDLKSRKWRRTLVTTFSHDTDLVQMPENFLGKVVEEIVDNAFKFSEPSTTVKVVALVNGPWAEIVVSDRGTGITPEQFSTHRAFRQYGRQLREQQGLGLGLCVAQRLLELNGGELEIAAARGGGTAVTIRVPLVRDARSAA